MLNFLINVPDILDSSGVYHPSLQNPGKQVKIRSGKASVWKKAVFFRCDLKQNGEFVLHSLTTEDAIKHRIYYPNNQNLALVLNLGDVISCDFNVVNKKLISPTRKMLEACSLLADTHPVKVFGKTVLNMTTTEVLSLIKGIIKKATAEISTIKDSPAIETVKIIFEIYQPSGSGRLIHQPASYRKWSDALAKSRGKSGKNKIQITDVFGNTGELSTELWPLRPIPRFKRFAAFQKNKDSECYSAYGFNSIETQPVTVESFVKINTNLDKLHSVDLHGKTWTTFGDGCLMHIVPTGMEDNDAASIIEYPSVLDICGESQFLEKAPEQSKDTQVYLSISEYKRLAEQVINNLRGQAKKTPKAAFQMLVIRKAGDGACQTLFADNINIAELAKNTQKWSDANAAVKHRNKRFKYVTVGDAVKLLNRRWTRGAGLDPNNMMVKNYGDSIDCNQFSYADLLKLFRDDDIGVAQRAINHFGRYHTNLLVDVASRETANEPTVLNGVRYDYFKLYALASVLFSKKGMTMDNVKEQPAYMIGVCVGIIDRLHKQLCDDERHGKYPRQLLGSTTVPMFLSGNSLPAWNHLVRSTQFITSWAKYKSFEKTAKTENAVFGAKENYHWLQKNLAKLADSGVPKTFSPEDRALFSLGFGSV